jgi:hypothetical protein
MKLKYFLQRFDWMKVYLSPFKPPVPKIYIGKTSIGTPYFLPRVWKKATPQKAIDAAIKEMKNVKKHNSVEGSYKRKVYSFGDLYERYLTHIFAEPKKIGFDFVGLGWKTKWTSTDYRFEWLPVWSFVFFGYQIAITFVPIEPHHYWECWLYYSRETTGTTKERLEQARKGFPCVWSSTRDGVKTTTCYWDVILKNKYL